MKPTDFRDTALADDDLNEEEIAKRLLDPDHKKQGAVIKELNAPVPCPAFIRHMP